MSDDLSTAHFRKSGAHDHWLEPSCVSAGALRVRGWSWRMMDELLGQPDYVAPNPERSDVSVRMWTKARVADAERMSAFQEYTKRRDKRRARPSYKLSNNDGPRLGKYDLPFDGSYVEYRNNQKRPSSKFAKQKRKPARHEAILREWSNTVDRCVPILSFALMEIAGARADAHNHDSFSVRREHARAQWVALISTIKPMLIGRAKKRKHGDYGDWSGIDVPRPKSKRAPARALLPVILPMVYVSFRAYEVELQRQKKDDRKTRRWIERVIAACARRARGWKDWPTDTPDEPEWSQVGAALGRTYRKYDEEISASDIELLRKLYPWR